MVTFPLEIPKDTVHRMSEQRKLIKGGYVCHTENRETRKGKAQTNQNMEEK